MTNVGFFIAAGCILLIAFAAGGLQYLFSYLENKKKG